MAEMISLNSIGAFIPRFICTTLILFCVTCLSAQVQWPAGKQHDFGQIKAGKEVSHVFTFINTGKTPLTIETTRTTCGCTATTFDPKPVPPGQSGQITVTFDGQVPLGKRFKKKVQVYFYEQRKAEVLRVRGEAD
jgi:Protein of unknown function (DUF1573)